MKIRSPHWILYLSLFLLYLLHNDFWFWHNPDLVLGFPVGLTYHIGFCAAASVVMALMVKYAWPNHLEDRHEKETER